MDFTKIVTNGIRACNTDMNLVTIGMELSETTVNATYDDVRVELRWFLPDDVYVVYIANQQFCWSADPMPIYAIFNNVSIFTEKELRNMKEAVS